MGISCWLKVFVAHLKLEIMLQIFSCLPSLQYLPVKEFNSIKIFIQSSSCLLCNPMQCQENVFISSYLFWLSRASWICPTLFLNSPRLGFLLMLKLSLPLFCPQQACLKPETRSFSAGNKCTVQEARRRLKKPHKHSNKQCSTRFSLHTNTL